MMAMTDWRTYRNGNPRQAYDLEQLARQRAAKLGYRVHRSRRRKDLNNAGMFMLIHKASSTVLLGGGFTASEEMILQFLERERQSPLTIPRKEDDNPASLAGAVIDDLPAPATTKLDS